MKIINIIIENKKSKIINVEIKGLLLSQFESIKSKLKMNNDAEVIRFLILNYYSDHLERIKNETRNELENNRVIINKFKKKYGEEWNNLSED